VDDISKRIEMVVWRGAIAESRHRVDAIVSDPEGRIVFDGGAITTTFRSAAKPFQLLPLVERGHAARWGWSDEQLAIMAASHAGSAYHVALVAGILERLGLEARHLECGFHEPFDPASRASVVCDPEQRSAIYNNCSGKHAGMLCLAKSEGWPVEGYTHADHPVQLLMRRVVAEMSGLEPEQLEVAVDGCGVSVFGLPLAGMARAYARLAAAPSAVGERNQALARIRRAMQTYPRAVSGEGRFDTALMEATGGRVVSKGGAEGMQCVGLPGRGVGIALKVEDGQARASAPAALAVLETLGVLESEELAALDAWRRPVIRNHAGTVVGRLEVHITNGADTRHATAKRGVA
jgi:L-asparaginase II